MNKAKNCRRLADLIEYRVKDEQFCMITWANQCGTVGCALGIAALSGEFKDQGLHWHPADINECPDHLSMEDMAKGRAWPMPVLNGKVVTWRDAGIRVFGQQAHGEVLNNPLNRSRQQVASELRKVADWMNA